MKNHGVLSTKSFQNSACTLSKKIAHFCQMEVAGNCWIIDWNVKCNVKNIFTLRQAFSIMLAWSAERLSMIVIVSERRRWPLIVESQEPSVPTIFCVAGS
jgi:hypothetical protein